MHRPARIEPRWRLPALVLLALALASCAGLPPRTEQPAAVAFELAHTPYLLDPASFELRRLPDTRPPDGLVLEFLLVRGTINGAPAPKLFRSVPVEAGADFELRLPAAIPGRVPAFAAAGLRIEPADTRVTRLGTFHYHPEYGMFRGGGGFIHAPSGDPVVLVHFSDPARLRGRQEDPTGIYRYRVDVERPGWNWLIMRTGAGNGFDVRRYTGPIDEIEFAVLLPPLMLRDGPGRKALDPSVSR